MPKIQALVAEFIGTFTLIFIGVGAIAAASTMGAPAGTGLVGIALAHGLAIAVMVSATAAVSGGHLNPAVTAGILVAGKIKPAGAALYIIAQCLGAIAAALLINHAVPIGTMALKTVNFGLPTLGSIQYETGHWPITAGMAVTLEAVLTFFLVFTVFGTAVDGRAPRVGGLYIGLAVTMGILVAGPLTGAALNPARHFGPAIASGQFHDMWIYWVGPLLGGIAAGAVYKFVLEK